MDSWASSTSQKSQLQTQIFLSSFEFQQHLVEKWKLLEINKAQEHQTLKQLSSVLCSLQWKFLSHFVAAVELLSSFGDDVFQNTGHRKTIAQKQQTGQWYVQKLKIVAFYFQSNMIQQKSTKYSRSSRMKRPTWCFAWSQRRDNEREIWLQRVSRKQLA